MPTPLSFLFRQGPTGKRRWRVPWAAFPQWTEVQGRLAIESANDVWIVASGVNDSDGSELSGAYFAQITEVFLVLRFESALSIMELAAPSTCNGASAVSFNCPQSKLGR